MTAMDVFEDLIVDARGLDAPEPMERVLGALTILRKGQRLRFRIHREPFPLYRMLERNGYAWKTNREADGIVEVVIWESQ